MVFQYFLHGILFFLIIPLISVTENCEYDENNWLKHGFGKYALIKTAYNTHQHEWSRKNCNSTTLNNNKIQNFIVFVNEIFVTENGEQDEKQNIKIVASNKQLL